MAGQAVLGKPPAVAGAELRERTAEALRHPRRLIKIILVPMEQRFEGLTGRIARFMFWSTAPTVGVCALIAATRRPGPPASTTTPAPASRARRTRARHG